MAGDGSKGLSEPELVGTLVSPRGLTKKMTMRAAGGQIGGLAGTLAANLATGDASQGAPDVPVFGRIGYLAASENELALTETTSLGWKPRSKGEALARVPRAELESLELGGGKVVSHLTLHFSNGVVWDFEIARAHKKGAKEFVTRLGGTIT
jgi:hypothetical protein